VSLKSGKSIQSDGEEEEESKLKLPKDQDHNSNDRSEYIHTYETEENKENEGNLFFTTQLYFSFIVKKQEDEKKIKDLDQKLAQEDNQELK
jgi:hypothetical protein